MAGNSYLLTNDILIHAVLRESKSKLEQLLKEKESECTSNEESQFFLKFKWLIKIITLIIIVTKILSMTMILIY